MPEYRVFVRDHDNHILSAGSTYICDNDQEALAKAEQLKDGLDLELWQGARKIARIAADVAPSIAAQNSSFFRPKSH
jgi:hypothetical protein